MRSAAWLALVLLLSTSSNAASWARSDDGSSRSSSAMSRAPTPAALSANWPLDQLEAATQLTDPLASARQVAEVLYRGRDFAGARAAAEAGLTVDARELRLHQLATSSALWAQDAAHARRALARWREALAAERDDVDDNARAWWGERVGESERLLAELDAQIVAVKECAERAHVVSLAVLAACTAAAVWLSYAGARDGGTLRGAPARAASPRRDEQVDD